MQPFQYIKERYGVLPRMNQAIAYQSRKGQIVADRGNYIVVNFFDEKVTMQHNIHPTDTHLVYLDEILKPRKMTRSQLRYRRFLYDDSGLTFAEWLGIDK